MRRIPFIYSLPLLGCMLLIAACKKDKVDLLDPVPTILSVTINPSNVVEYQDSIVFSVAYRDGDGDLGENAPDVKNLFFSRQPHPSDAGIPDSRIGA